MISYCKTIWARLIGAWLVLRGDAVPVPVFDSDTTILVVETEGSHPSFLSCRSFVESDSSYNILLAKILVWVCSKNRFFWSSDVTGSALKELAEDYYEEHKNMV